MKFEPVELVHVYYKPKAKKILVGRLALKSRKIFFEYDKAFLEFGINLSPFKLPLKSGVVTSDDFTFEGLFGVFNDSLPDGWGRLLLDRSLMKHNFNPNALSPLDRLCFVGENGMGALIYEPDRSEKSTVSKIDLDKIADEVREFQNNDDDRFVEDLLHLGGSSAGARPKVLLDIDNENWIVKFRSATDPQDIGSIEYAYHLMAAKAGLDVSPARLFPSRKGQGFFGCKRFDRLGNSSLHMHSICGLLHSDHRIPSLDYQNILAATMHLTRDIRECEKQFRLCAFNILSHNRDDHGKNFSYLLKNDLWHVAPAYDLTFSSGPGNEHCSMVVGEGKHPGVNELLVLANTCSIKKPRAIEIIEEVKSAVNRWQLFADEAEVGSRSRKLIDTTIKKIIKDRF